MASKLEREFKYFLANRDELLRKHKGKYVVIKGDEVIGVFDTQIDALTESRKHHAAGSFLIQLVDEGSDSYSQSFHSRVAFS